jgi:hypothetical protein
VLFTRLDPEITVALVPAAPPVTDPIGVATGALQLYVVDGGIIFPPELGGVKEKAESLQIVRAVSRTNGFGFNATVTLKVLPGQPKGETGVTV